MDINISEIVNKKLKELESNKTVEKQIEESIQKTVIGAVSDALEDYSLKRNIEKQISEQVSDIVANIGFSAYNQFISDTIKRTVVDSAKNDIKKKITEAFDTIFVKKLDSIKISDVFKQYSEVLENLDEDERQRAEDGYSFSSFIDESDGAFKYITIIWALESQEVRSRYSCAGDDDYKMEMRLSAYSDEPYTISSLEWQGQDLTKADSLYNMSDFEALLASLYFNKTKVEIDMDEDDMSYGLWDC